MNDKELYKRIDEVAKEFRGQIPDLYRIVGVVVVGRLYGWRVVRLTVSGTTWAAVTKWFGDPKDWMPERGRLAYKSVGLKLVDQIGDYWAFIKGHVSRDDISATERKRIA
jgi:hypothetical protein